MKFVLFVLLILAPVFSAGAGSFFWYPCIRGKDAFDAEVCNSTGKTPIEMFIDTPTIVPWHTSWYYTIIPLSPSSFQMSFQKTADCNYREQVHPCDPSIVSRFYNATCAADTYLGDPPTVTYIMPSTGVLAIQVYYNGNFGFQYGTNYFTFDCLSTPVARTTQTTPTPVQSSHAPAIASIFDQYDDFLSKPCNFIRDALASRGIRMNCIN